MADIEAIPKRISEIEHEILEQLNAIQQLGAQQQNLQAQINQRRNMIAEYEAALKELRKLI